MREKSKFLKNHINVKTPNLPFNPTISGYTGKTVNLYTKRKEWSKEPDASLVAGLALDISYLQDLQFKVSNF